MPKTQEIKTVVLYLKIGKYNIPNKSRKISIPCIWYPQENFSKKAIGKSQ